LTNAEMRTAKEYLFSRCMEMSKDA